jgi:hypothetical protein
MSFERSTRFRSRTPVPPPVRPIGLSDTQLSIVMAAARGLSFEKREDFLTRVMATLRRRGRADDIDVDVAVHAALVGLVQEAPAA